jgi:hypothetical protein
MHLPPGPNSAGPGRRVRISHAPGGLLGRTRPALVQARRPIDHITGRRLRRPRYQSSGLYAEYERLHPGIRIVRSDTTAQASYWPALEVYEYYADSLGFSSPETRTDYSNFTSAYNTTNYEAVFNYHRFWAEVDIATAFEPFAQLFPTAAPPSGF